MNTQQKTEIVKEQKAQKTNKYSNMLSLMNNKRMIVKEESALRNINRTKRNFSYSSVYITELLQKANKNKEYSETDIINKSDMVLDAEMVLNYICELAIEKYLSEE